MMRHYSCGDSSVGPCSITIKKCLYHYTAIAKNSSCKCRQVRGARGLDCGGGVDESHVDVCHNIAGGEPIITHHRPGRPVMTPVMTKGHTSSGKCECKYVVPMITMLTDFSLDCPGPLKELQASSSNQANARPEVFSTWRFISDLGVLCFRSRRKRSWRKHSEDQKPPEDKPLPQDRECGPQGRHLQQPQGGGQETVGEGQHGPRGGQQDPRRVWSRTIGPSRRPTGSSKPRSRGFCIGPCCSPVQEAPPCL